MNSDRRIGHGVAHQRDEAGMPDAGTEGTMRVKPQRFVDVGGQRGWIHTTNVGEVTSGERASDWAGLFP